jgi:DNA-binding transcriptional ArsR family regulator
MLFALQAPDGRAVRELCVCDLAAVTGMSKSLTSHQLRLLRSAKLVVVRRDGNAPTIDWPMDRLPICSATHFRRRDDRSVRERGAAATRGSSSRPRWSVDAGLRKVVRAALPLPAFGALVAAFHVLLVAGVFPERLEPCKQGVPCSETVIVRFGFVTIPLPSFAAFAAIAALLTFAYSRSSTWGSRTCSSAQPLCWWWPLRARR